MDRKPSDVSTLGHKPTDASNISHLASNQNLPDLNRLSASFNQPATPMILQTQVYKVNNQFSPSKRKSKKSAQNSPPRGQQHPETSISTAPMDRTFSAEGYAAKKKLLKCK